MIRPVLSFAVALTLSAGLAEACSATAGVPSNVPVHGSACSVSTQVEEYRSVRLTRATDLGRGFVRQNITDGGGCGYENNLIVHDCGADRLLVVGWEMFDVMDSLTPNSPQPALERITDRIDQAAQGGSPLTLSAIAGLARSERLPTALELAGGTRVSINGHGVSTSCACQTYYP